MVRMYLSAEAARNLHSFRYSGGDQSFLYVNFLSPLSETLSGYCPDWVSANLVPPTQISYTGHLCLMAGYWLCVGFCGLSLACFPPKWVLWLALALQVGWLVLDNIDGKQARRLGISSPLGLLFDHQVDALSVFTTATLVAIVSGFGDTPFSLGCLGVGMLPFFFATWEELNAGKMMFMRFSGPSEGAFIICSYIAFMTYETPEVARTIQVAGYPLPTAVFWAHMQVAHVSSTTYTPLNVSNFLLLTALLVNTAAHHFGYGLVDEYHLLVVLIVAAAASYYCMALSVCKEISEELGIPVLTVPRRKKA